MTSNTAPIVKTKIYSCGENPLSSGSFRMTGFADYDLIYLVTQRYAQGYTLVLPVSAIRDGAFGADVVGGVWFLGGGNTSDLTKISFGIDGNDVVGSIKAMPVPLFIQAVAVKFGNGEITAAFDAAYSS